MITGVGIESVLQQVHPLKRTSLSEYNLQKSQSGQNWKENKADDRLFVSLCHFFTSVRNESENPELS